jgi:hypothetical protein
LTQDIAKAVLWGSETSPRREHGVSRALTEKTIAVTRKREQAPVGNAGCARRGGEINADRREVMLGYSTKQ